MKKSIQSKLASPYQKNKYPVSQSQTPHLPNIVNFNKVESPQFHLNTARSYLQNYLKQRVPEEKLNEISEQVLVNSTSQQRTQNESSSKDLSLLTLPIGYKQDNYNYNKSKYTNIISKTIPSIKKTILKKEENIENPKQSKNNLYNLIQDDSNQINSLKKQTFLSFDEIQSTNQSFMDTLKLYGKFNQNELNQIVREVFPVTPFYLQQKQIKESLVNSQSSYNLQNTIQSELQNNQTIKNYVQDIETNNYKFNQRFSNLLNLRQKRNLKCLNPKKIESKKHNSSALSLTNFRQMLSNKVNEKAKLELQQKSNSNFFITINKQELISYRPNGREQAGLAYCNNLAYCFGGFGIKALNDLFCIDCTNQLNCFPMKQQKTPKPRHGHSFCYYRQKNELIVYGGEKSNQNQSFFKSRECYNEV